MRSQWLPAVTTWTSNRCWSVSTRTPSWWCPTFGVTYTGSYEPVLELSEALDQLQKEKGLDIDIHVDGASGAFLRPLLRPGHAVGLSGAEGQVDLHVGHKFGLAPLGVGWVLWRDTAELPDDLIFHVTYLGGDMPVFQINFSRPAGQIVAQYYNFVRLGRDGYRNVHDACYDTGKFLAREIVKLGPFELLCDSDPESGHSLGGVANQGRRGSRATPCTTSPTGSESRVGKCRHIR